MAVKDMLFALITGMVMGGVFSILRLPVPAPQTFAGVLGVAGIFLGYLIVQTFLR